VPKAVVPPSTPSPADSAPQAALGDATAEPIAAATSSAKAKGAAAKPAGGQLRTDWQPKFLRKYAESGSRSRSAFVAGVSVRTVRKTEIRDAEFAQQLAEAHAAFVESLEEELVKLGRSKTSSSVTALQTRLRAEAPTKYNDKLQIEGAIKSLNVSVAATPQQAAELLREMLESATDATRERLMVGSGATPAALADVAGSPVVIDAN
jgi:hypothetical protein